MAKNFYVIKNCNKAGIYKSLEEANQVKAEYPFSLLKGFYDKNKAIEYLNKSNDIDDFTYVVKIGKIPGIYKSANLAYEQIKRYDGALLKKFRNEDIVGIENFWNLDINEIYKNRQLKKDKNEIRKNKEKEINKVPISPQTIKLKGNNVCFIDCEANDCNIISFGCVILNVETYSITEKFYRTVKPKFFTKLGEFYENLTGLTNEEIEKSDEIDTVFLEFKNILKKHNVVDIFSWSNSDRKYLNKSLKNYEVNHDKTLNQIKDIQVCISSYTRPIINKKQWSLDDMKKICGIDRPVLHNALSDAKDLCSIFICWKEDKIDLENVKKVVQKNSIC